MSSSETKITRLQEKQENMFYDAERKGDHNSSTVDKNEQIADKMIKIIIVTMLYVFKKLRRDMEDFKKAQIRLPEVKTII